MKVITYLKNKVCEWRQKKLAAIRKDITFRNEMIRQCQREMKLDTIPLSEFENRARTIEVNVLRIQDLRECESFFESFA